VIVTEGNRYHVTVIERKGRKSPFQLRIHDRVDHGVTRETLHGLTIRQRGAAHVAAAAREAAMNSGAGPMTVVSWTEARAEAEAVIEGEHHERPATIRAYRKSLDAFERYAEEVLKCRPGPAGQRLQFVAQVDLPIARKFPGWRLKHGRTRDGRPVEVVGVATVNRDLRTLAAFWGTLCQIDLAASNPWRKVKHLRGFKREHVRLTAVQAAALLRKARSFGSKFHAAVALALDCGPRVGELCHVTWPHVDTKAGTWLITKEACGWLPKGVCERTVRFSPETGRLLDRWRRAAVKDRASVKDLAGQGIDKADAAVLVDAGRVFGTGREKGADNYERTFNGQLRRACRAAGVPEITTHGLRYTVGRLAADAGAMPTAIQEFLGHAAIQTTMGYVGHGQVGGPQNVAEALQRARKIQCAPVMPGAGAEKTGKNGPRRNPRNDKGL